MPPATSSRPDIRSCAASNPVSPGAGVTSIACSDPTDRLNRLSLTHPVSQATLAPGSLRESGRLSARGSGTQELPQELGEADAPVSVNELNIASNVGFNCSQFCSADCARTWYSVAPSKTKYISDLIGFPSTSNVVSV